MSTLSCSEVIGKRLSRRRARTANVPLAGLVSAIAAAIAASGVLSTRSARQTRTIPGTSATRAATRSIASACSAAVMRSAAWPSPWATRSTSTPSRTVSSTGTPVVRTAARTLACCMRTNCWRFFPLRKISPSLSSTHGSPTVRLIRRSGAVTGSVMDIPPVCQLCGPAGALAAPGRPAGGAPGVAGRWRRRRGGSRPTGTFRDKALILALSPGSRIP